MESLLSIQRLGQNLHLVFCSGAQGFPVASGQIKFDGVITDSRFRAAFQVYFAELGIRANDWDSLFREMNEEGNNLRDHDNSQQEQRFQSFHGKPPFNTAAWPKPPSCFVLSLQLEADSGNANIEILLPGSAVLYSWHWAPVGQMAAHWPQAKHQVLLQR